MSLFALYFLRHASQLSTLRSLIHRRYTKPSTHSTKLAVLTSVERDYVTSYPSQTTTYSTRRFSTDGSSKDSDEQTLGAMQEDVDGIDDERSHDIIADELIEMRRQESITDVSESGFLLDYMADANSLSSTTQLSSEGQFSEEGFCLHYTVPIPPKGRFSLLDYARAAGTRKPQRTRKWVHLLDGAERPVDLSDANNDFEESQAKEIPPPTQTVRYRANDQNKLREMQHCLRPPWSTRSISSMEQIFDKGDYCELRNGARLGNKISDDELPVHLLNADTRESLYFTRKQEVAENPLMNVAAIEDLEAKIVAERALRMKRGIEYQPMMLLTVGAQGSGKSKFALELVEHGALPWCRINQDNIRNGKRGTRTDCVNKARQMINEGYCIIIDRMNFSVVQRDEMVTLARRLGCPVHAIVFRLPFVENVYNVAVRTNHEGNFEGSSDLHRQIIYYTRFRLFNGGHPKENNEGFHSVFECRSNEDYAFAFRQWMNIGRKESDGTRLTLETWRRNQTPWRVQDSSKLEEIEEIVNQERLWLQPPQLPQIVPFPHNEEESQPTSDTIGYVPSRDGPLDMSEDEV